jgi:hypothetical protein
VRDTARPSPEPRSVSLNLGIHNHILKVPNVVRCSFWYRFGKEATLLLSAKPSILGGWPG